MGILGEFDDSMTDTSYTRVGYVDNTGVRVCVGIKLGYLGCTMVYGPPVVKILKFSKNLEVEENRS